MAMMAITTSSSISVNARRKRLATIVRDMSCHPLERGESKELQAQINTGLNETNFLPNPGPRAGMPEPAGLPTRGLRYFLSSAAGA
jgi:hypothetical protein